MITEMWHIIAHITVFMLSHSNAAKYLSVLEAGGKVESYQRKPYRWWRVREGQNLS